MKNLNITPKIIGWGQTENYQPTSPHLLQADVSIVDNPTCSKKYASFIDITSNQICAGDDERDSCKGGNLYFVLNRIFIRVQSNLDLATLAVIQKYVAKSGMLLF